MKRVHGKWLLSALGAGALSLVLAAPASAVELDCTLGCAEVSFDGAIWSTNDNQSTGTGVIQSFVRISGNSLEVDGHNTSARPLLNDENNSPIFTRSLLLSNVPLVDIGGTLYYEFLLDINQKDKDPLLSLSGVEICVSTDPSLSEADGCPGTTKYSMTGGNYVLLDYGLNSGSGSGDLFMYIPLSTLGAAGTNYVYLYSIFGEVAPFGNNDGFEEWAVRTATLPPPDGGDVPEPASLALLGVGLLAGGMRLRKKIGARA